jgi:SWI/SNF-related matrix-associated actin-dependent regulator 1 of chromatin subfamily A
MATKYLVRRSETIQPDLILLDGEFAYIKSDRLFYIGDGKTPMSKLKPFNSLVDGENGQKLIVFCYLKEVVADLKREFRQAVTVTGDDSQQEKQYAVDKFQTDEKCRLIILNYKSGGVGLTLTAASNVLFVEQPWTYSECCQAEDRAHRNGQKNAVSCVYLLGNETIDEYMFELIQTKKGIADGVTGTEDTVEQSVVKESDLIFGAAMHLFGNKK